MTKNGLSVTTGTTIEEIVENINQAIQLRKHGPTYTRAHVVAIYWEESGGHNTKGDCEAFCTCMIDNFGFTTETIPLYGGFDKLASKLFTIGAKLEDALLILYYSGEGLINKSNNSLVIHGIDPQSPASVKEGKYAIQFNNIKSVLNMLDNKPHLLYVLDCCYAGGAARGGDRCVEFLCASNATNHSFSDANEFGLFTQVVTEALETLKEKQQSFSIETLAMLVQKDLPYAYYTSENNKNSIRLHPKSEEKDLDPSFGENPVNYIAEFKWDEDFTEEQVRSLATRLREISMIHGLKMECKSTFYTNSTHFLFQVSLIGLDILKGWFPDHIVRVVPVKKEIINF
jgi:hypothetical protein